VRIRAVLPPFLPLEEIRARIAPTLPDLEIVPGVFSPGRWAPEEVEVLVLTTFHALPADAIARMTSLKFVQVASTGYDRVDLAACRARGIMVSNIPVANSTTVAEHVVMMALVLLRDLRAIDADLRKGEWPMLTGTHDLAGRVVGIAGFGRIGREVARRLAGFSVTLLYADPKPATPEVERELGITRVEWPELLRRSDILTLHLPLTTATRGILGPAEFASMKDQTIVINTARAELVDAAAMRAAVTEGRVLVGLDVYPTEPPDFSDPIFGMPNTVFTPHIAGVTFEAQRRFLEATVENVRRYVAGEPPRWRVDPE
jgi:phosphoglycerate dehydrogenase-like enzyme